MYVALVTQHAKRVRHNILSSVACPAVSYFATLCHKKHDFLGKNFIKHEMYSGFKIPYIPRKFNINSAYKYVETKWQLIIIIFINCNWVISRWQWLFYMYTNMARKKKVTRKFKSGGLHERNVVAAWKLGNHLSIRL